MADSSFSDASSGFFDGLVVYSPAEIRMIGLRLVNYTPKRIRKAKTKRNNEQFVGHFGASPAIVAKIWEDLQITANPDAWLPPEERKLEWFLMGLHHLKRYPTDLEREAIFDTDEMKGVTVSDIIFKKFVN